nr:hypothetical protein [Tanacetum cinerariifolium]
CRRPSRPQQPPGPPAKLGERGALRRRARLGEYGNRAEILASGAGPGAAAHPASQRALPQSAAQRAARQPQSRPHCPQRPAEGAGAARPGA